MNLTAFRQRFPEYDDIPDMEVSKIVSELFEAPTEHFPIEEAMKVLADGFKSLEQAFMKQPKVEKEKKNDYSAYLTALGLQLSKIETAISDFKVPEIIIPEVKMPEHKQVKSLKVKRNDLGYITEIIPQY